MASDPLAGLFEALEFTPENIPLRLHLAQSLMQLGRLEEAEAQYRSALSRQPKEEKILLALVKLYIQQDKTSQALVIVEDLLRKPNPAGLAYVLHAKLLVKEGDVARAGRQYREGINLDPEAADADWANRYGISTAGNDFDDDSSEEEDRLPAGDIPLKGDTGINIPMEQPKQTFADVGGMEPIKEEIRIKIIHPLQHADLYKAYGKSIGGGILMYGPPGCGKTHLARATAGEVNARFLSVGINDVLDMWMGSSEKNLHALFDQARSNKPCVLFFDEVDALAASRSDFRTSSGRMLINQFLNELDGVQASNDGVLILAATNAPWHLDSAFRRPGRFDRILFVPPPDAPARVSILKVMLQGKPQENVDYDYVAKKTDGFSGADLKAVLDLAVEAKLREAMKSGLPKPLSTKDLSSAAAQVKPSTKEWFNTARNYALFSNQGGQYDDIIKYLKL